MRKRLEHLYWKASDFGKNCLTAVLLCVLFAAMYACGMFSFWFKIKVVDFLFGL